MAEPIQIRLHYSSVGLRLGDRVAESLIEDKARRDVLVLQAAIKLESVGNWNALIHAAVLDQSRSLCLLDRGDRGRLRVDSRIVPRRGVEILARERSDV